MDPPVERNSSTSVSLGELSQTRIYAVSMSATHHERVQVNGQMVGAKIEVFVCGSHDVPLAEELMDSF